MPTKCLRDPLKPLYLESHDSHHHLPNVRSKVKAKATKCIWSGIQIENCPKISSLCPLTEERRNDSIVGSPCISPGGAGAAMVGPTIIGQLGHLFELAWPINIIY